MKYLILLFLTACNAPRCDRSIYKCPLVSINIPEVCITNDCHTQNEIAHWYGGEYWELRDTTKER